MKRQRNPIKTVMTAVIVGVLLLMMLTAQVNYSLTEQGVLVRYRYLVMLPQTERLIAYETIQSAEVLPQLPPMRKITGFESFGRMLIGRFRNDTMGELQVYVQNTRIPQLLVRTSDKTYLISPGEAEVFAQQMRDRIKR